MDVTDWAVNHRLPQVYWISHFCSKSLNDEVYLNAWKAHAGVRINSVKLEPSELKTDLCTNSLSKDDRQPELVLTLFYLQFITDLKLLWSSSLISDWWSCVGVLSMYKTVCVCRHKQKNTSVFLHMKKHIASKACFRIIFHPKIKRNKYIYFLRLRTFGISKAQCNKTLILITIMRKKLWFIIMVFFFYKKKKLFQLPL